MITLGLDPHPASHTVVALDHNGSSLGSIEAPNTDAGLEELHRFASQYPGRRWAIEGAGNHFISRFVTQLLAKGEVVYPIAPSLTSQYRCRRGRKKNDQVDAACHCAQQESALRIPRSRQYLVCHSGSGVVGQANGAGPIGSSFRDEGGLGVYILRYASPMLFVNIETSGGIGIACLSPPGMPSR
jgi:hypothetical protein